MPQYCIEPSNAPFDKGELAEQMVSDCIQAIRDRSGGQFSYSVKNIHRSIGARLSGEIAQAHGESGLGDKPITLNLTGSADKAWRLERRGAQHEPERRC